MCVYCALIHLKVIRSVIALTPRRAAPSPPAAAPARSPRADGTVLPLCSGHAAYSPLAPSTLKTMTAARYVGAALSASVARLPQTPPPPLLQKHSLCRCYILFFPLLAFLFRPALAFFDTIRKLLSTLTKHVYQTHIIFCYCFYLFLLCTVRGWASVFICCSSL